MFDFQVHVALAIYIRVSQFLSTKTKRQSLTKQRPTEPQAAVCQSANEDDSGIYQLISEAI